MIRNGPGPGTGPELDNIDDNAFLIVEIFPSFDESSSDYNEASPNYCKYYRAIPSDDGCQFTKEVT